jgi:hypothetical protein
MEAEEKIDLFKNEHNRLKDFSVQMQVIIRSYKIDTKNKAQIINSS